MTSFFLVSTDKCLICNNQIHAELGKLRGVFAIEMDRIEGKITVTHTDEVSRTEIADKLNSIGFPEIKEN